MDQTVCRSDHALLFERLRISYSSASVHARERKKCRPSELVLLQEGDHPFRRLFIVCDNILDTSSKSGLDGDLVLFVHLDDISHNTDQAFFPVPVCHDFPDAVPVSVISLGNVFQRFQSGGLSVVCGLADPQFFLFLRQFFLKAADLLFIFRDFLIINTDLFPYLPEFFLIL